VNIVQLGVYLLDLGDSILLILSPELSTMIVEDAKQRVVQPAAQVEVVE
jgi:hypothetical protein